MHGTPNWLIDYYLPKYYIDPLTPKETNPMTNPFIKTTTKAETSKRCVSATEIEAGDVITGLFNDGQIELTVTSVASSDQGKVQLYTDELGVIYFQEGKYVYVDRKVETEERVELPIPNGTVVKDVSRMYIRTPYGWTGSDGVNYPHRDLDGRVWGRPGRQPVEIIHPKQ